MRNFEHQKNRLQTEPIYFGKDLGLFIPIDNCVGYEEALKEIIPLIQDKLIREILEELRRNFHATNYQRSQRTGKTKYR